MRRSLPRALFSFSLCRSSGETVFALEELVKAGRASSQTALVEELIRQEKVRLDMQHEEKKLDAAWKAAMQDKSYRTEIRRTMDDFATADSESAELIQ